MKSWYAIFFSLIATLSVAAQSSFFLSDAKEKERQMLSEAALKNKIEKNIFIKVTASSKHCFVGEPVLVTYQLFSALPSVSKVSKQPVFTNCSVYEVDGDEASYLTKINRTTYRVFLIRKVQLIPLQEGTLTLPSVAVNNEVTFYEEDNFFKPKIISATVESAPVSIQVERLPLQNKPVKFSGMVGNFTIRMYVKNSVCRLEEANVLTLEVEGEGNVSLANIPVVKWPANMEFFEASTHEWINKSSYPLQGKKVFSLPFIIHKKGNDSLAPVAFNFFNPKTRTYQTTYSNALSLEVLPALSAQIPTVSSSPINSSAFSYFKNNWLAMALMFSGFGVLLFFGLNKHRFSFAGIAKKSISVKELPVKQIVRPASYRNENINTIMNSEGIEFYKQLKQLLVTALQEKLQTAEINEAKLLELFSKQNVSKEIIAETQQIFKVCNLHIYTPFTDETDKEQVYQQSMQLLQQLSLMN